MRSASDNIFFEKWGILQTLNFRIRYFFNPFFNQFCHYNKTIHLICTANQLTGFCMVATSGWNELKVFDIVSFNSLRRTCETVRPKHFSRNSWRSTESMRSKNNTCFRANRWWKSFSPERGDCFIRSMWYFMIRPVVRRPKTEY